MVVAVRELVVPVVAAIAAQEGPEQAGRERQVVQATARGPVLVVVALALLVQRTPHQRLAVPVALVLRTALLEPQLLGLVVAVVPVVLLAEPVDLVAAARVL